MHSIFNFSCCSQSSNWKKSCRSPGKQLVNFGILSDSQIVARKLLTDMIMDKASSRMEWNDRISSENDISVLPSLDIEHENVGNTLEDSGILNDFDEILERRAMIDDCRDVIQGSMTEYQSVNRSIFNRRHSEGGISILPSIPHRRSSLQIPSRIYRSQNYHHNSEIFYRTNGSSPIRLGIGSELFINFLQEEINRCNLKIPDSFQDFTARGSSQRSPEDVCAFHNLGTHLRLMADEFASSDQRRRVREHAERIPLRNLDSESFTNLLFGMFQEGGVTCERVLVLFVFCADLAMRALREHLITCFNDVMNWSQVYIESWLTPWIQRHGGWAVVLERSVHEAYKAVVIGACLMGMLALWTYIRTANH